MRRIILEIDYNDEAVVVKRLLGLFNQKEVQSVLVPHDFLGLVVEEVIDNGIINEVAVL